MDKIYASLLVNIPCVLFGILSFILCYNKIEGWGWFMFLSIISVTTLKFKEEDVKDNEENISKS